jgi:hypothetical protein
MKAMELCHKFLDCSVNKCPLDKDIKLRSHITNEPKCSLPYATRSRYRRKAKNLCLL